MKKGSGMLSGMTCKSPMQMNKGDPKMTTAYPSVDANATRKETAPTPKTLGPRDA